MSPVPKLITGAAGVLLVASLFLPWASAAGVDRSGWELLTIADVFLLIVGVIAITAALTGGRIGVFRPDVSLIGAADLFAVAATIMLAWLVIFDFPGGAGREVGVFLALAGTVGVAAGAGDYSTLRGAPMFPRLAAGDRDL